MRSTLLSGFHRRVLTLFSLLLLTATASAVQAQDTTQALANGALTIGLELFPSNGGGSFMRSYAMLGTRRQSLPLIVAPAATVHVPLGGSMRLTLHSSYMSSTILDHYVLYDTSGGMLRQSPGISDELSITAVPILAGIDLVSAPAQFGSHIGIEAGLSIANVDWTTTSQGNSGFDFFRPIINTSGISIAPAFRLVAGVTYDFDKARAAQTVIRGLYLEASYLTIPVSRDFFATLRRQGRGFTPPDEDDATLDLGGPSLTFGLVINLAGR